MSQHMRQQQAAAYPLGWGGATVVPGSYFPCSPGVPHNDAAGALHSTTEGEEANPSASGAADLTAKQATVCLPSQPSSAVTLPCWIGCSNSCGLRQLKPLFGLPLHFLQFVLLLHLSMPLSCTCMFRHSCICSQSMEYTRQRIGRCGWHLSLRMQMY
jgi:hypothetical protein